MNLASLKGITHIQSGSEFGFGGRHHTYTIPPLGPKHEEGKAGITGVVVVVVVVIVVEVIVSVSIIVVSYRWGGSR